MPRTEQRKHDDPGLLEKRLRRLLEASTKPRPRGGVGQGHSLYVSECEGENRAQLSLFTLADDDARQDGDHG